MTAEAGMNGPFHLSNFAERVRVALAASDVSPRQLAKACDVSPQSVSKWMKGKCAPRSSHLLVLARMTGANLEWLMTPSRVPLRANPPETTNSGGSDDADEGATMDFRET